MVVVVVVLRGTETGEVKEIALPFYYSILDLLKKNTVCEVSALLVIIFGFNVVYS